MFHELPRSMEERSFLSVFVRVKYVPPTRWQGGPNQQSCITGNREKRRELIVYGVGNGQPSGVM
jgi:hypothetical protein